MKDKKLSIADYIIAILFATTIFIVAAQVIFRYVFNSSLTWSEELVRYLFSWIIFLGAALAIKNGTHIRVDFLVNKLPAKISRFLKLFNYVVISAFLILLAILGFMLVVRTANTLSPALSLPINYVFYASLPVTGLLGIYYAIARIISTLRSESQHADKEIE